MRSGIYKSYVEKLITRASNESTWTQRRMSVIKNSVAEKVENISFSFPLKQKKNEKKTKERKGRHKFSILT